MKYAILVHVRIVFQKKSFLFFFVAIMMLLNSIFYIISAFMISFIILPLAPIIFLISILTFNMKLPIIVTNDCLYIPRNSFNNIDEKIDSYDVLQTKNIVNMTEYKYSIEIEIINGVKRSINKNYNNQNIKKLKQSIPFFEN